MKLRRIIKSKKAGLEISTNAIVILIFAITILSLGIVFIRKIFTGVIDQFTNVAGETRSRLKEDLLKANARLVLELNEITIKAGENKLIGFAVKNELEEDETFTLLGKGKIGNDGKWDGSDSVIMCYSSTADNAKLEKITIKTVEKAYIKKGESVVFNLEIRVARDAVPGTYYCGFVIKDPNQQNVVEYADQRFTIFVE
ncbi:MAG: hypothetical protein ACP5OZ_02330 [Candidatus Woesearchaeota archaeon]